MAGSADYNGNVEDPSPGNLLRGRFVLCYASNFRAEADELLLRGTTVADLYRAAASLKELLYPAPDTWLYLPTFCKRWREVMGIPFPPPTWGDTDMFFDTHTWERLVSVVFLPEGDIVFKPTDKWIELLNEHLREMEQTVPLLAMERLSLRPCRD